jgi:hypothetical protein
MAHDLENLDNIVKITPWHGVDIVDVYKKVSERLNSEKNTITIQEEEDASEKTEGVDIREI